jgi:hypothetical protein
MSVAVDDGYTMDPDEATELAASARKILRAYAGLYRRRAYKGDGRPFTNPEANALATLALQRATSARPRDFDGEQIVVSMYSLTHSLMTDGYSRAVAVVGLSWGDGYGTLPLDAPPLKILDSITTTGAAPGAVSGLYAGAWHALFLTSAIPLLNARTRPTAVQQLARWSDYVRPKLAAMSSAPAPDLADLADLSQRARIAAAAGPLAERLGDESLGDNARSLIEPWLADAAGPSTLSTAHVAQLAAAAIAVGLPQHGVSLVRMLIDHRLDDGRSLLRAHGDDKEQIETSPWVPLAVIDASALARDAAAGSEATRAPAIGSRLGEALRRAARNAS